MASGRTPSSFGGGYGINRGLSAQEHLGTAIPPHSHVTVKPGNKTSRSAVGKTGGKYFSGSTRPGEKNR